MASRPNSVDYARFVREHVETCFNRDEWEDAERFYRPDIVVNHPAIGEPVRGIAAFRELVNTARTGFPDVHWEVVDVFGGWDGDREKTAVRFRVTGTHTGDFVGFPPRGKSFDVEELSIAHLDEGRIKEIWVIPDLTSQMQQLGLIPSGPPPKAMLFMMRTMQKLQRSK